MSEIEQKLPPLLQMNWYREIHKESSTVVKTEKFPHLLKFLSMERDALEYATSTVRTSGGGASGNLNILRTTDISCVVHYWSDNHPTPECGLTTTFH